MSAVHCLACGGRIGEGLFSIPNLPLVDSFVPSQNAARSVPCYSVDVSQCVTCQTIQIVSPPDTSNIYREYIYESASSPDLFDHFTAYAQYVKSLGIQENRKILEIGANDGLFLSRLAHLGYNNMIACDPSPQTGDIHINGVTVINDFFSESAVRHIPRNSCSVIIANNCFSHIPRLVDTLRLCGDLLESNGLLIIEVQSALDLVQNVVFDYVYHEHYFYHTATSFGNLAKLSGLELLGVQHLTIKGGSYRFLVGHPGKHRVHGSVAYWIYRELVAGVHSFATWDAMRVYLNDVRTQLHSFLACRSQIVIGYGACATGTVFLRYMGLEKLLNSVVDDNPKRQNLYCPGSGIPTRALAEVGDADVCLVLAWRHWGGIARKLSSRKIPFIVPLPTISFHQ